MIGIAKVCEIELSYTIGVEEPTAITIDTQATSVISEKRIEEFIKENFDLRPSSIIEMFNLRQPIYSNTASYGHFGRDDIEFPWERLDQVDKFKTIV